jgi:hypothetical protein
MHASKQWNGSLVVWKAQARDLPVPPFYGDLADQLASTSQVPDNGKQLRFIHRNLLTSLHACEQNCALGLSGDRGSDPRRPGSDSAALLQWRGGVRLEPGQGSGLGGDLAALLAGIFGSVPLAPAISGGALIDLPQVQLSSVPKS